MSNVADDRFWRVLAAVLGAGGAAYGGYQEGQMLQREQEERRRREEEERRRWEAQMELERQQAELTRGRYQADVLSRYQPAPYGPMEAGREPTTFPGMEGEYVPRPTEYELAQAERGRVKAAGPPGGLEDAYIWDESQGRYIENPLYVSPWEKQLAGMRFGGAGAAANIKSPDSTDWMQAWRLHYGVMDEAEIATRVEESGDTMEQAMAKVYPTALQFANPMMAGVGAAEPGPERPEPTEDELRDIAYRLSLGDLDAVQELQILQEVAPDVAQRVLEIQAQGPSVPHLYQMPIRQRWRSVTGEVGERGREAAGRWPILARADPVASLMLSLFGGQGGR